MNEPKFNVGKLVVCEGRSDAGVLQQIILKAGLHDIEVDFPRDDGKASGGGVDRFGHRLRAIRTKEEFIENVKTVVVVGDNDDADAFKRICVQLSEAGITAPHRPQEFVGFGEGKRICVFLVPPGGWDCLERLCVDAALVKWPRLRDPLQNYQNLSPAAGWSRNKKSKMELQCILAATCEKRPEVMLADLWQKDERFHFPVDDAAFAPVREFLNTL